MTSRRKNWHLHCPITEQKNYLRVKLYEGASMSYKKYLAVVTVGLMIFEFIGSSIPEHRAQLIRIVLHRGVHNQHLEHLIVIWKIYDR